MSYFLRLSCLVCFMCLMSANLYAGNLGVIGQTFPIAEEDFLDFIQNNVTTMRKNGEWQKLENDFKNRVASSSDRPAALNIPRAIKNKDHLFDPSVILPFDLKDHFGRVLVNKGTKVNPLSLIKMQSIWIFFNGDDAEQVSWVKEYSRNQTHKMKLILTQGSISQMEKVFKLPIYFDQKGKITTKLSIQYVPALVTQEGKYLKISEVTV